MSTLFVYRSPRFAVDESHTFGLFFPTVRSPEADRAVSDSTTNACMRTAPARLKPAFGLGDEASCRSSASTAAPIDPYGGNGAAYWTYSVPDAARQWAHQNGCSPSPTTSEPQPGVTLTKYSPCQATADVQLYALTGEGHEWPGGPSVPRALSRVLGPQSNAVDANTTMWTFFADQPMP